MSFHSANFLHWFADSKVSDESSRPLIVYRGEHGAADLWNNGNNRTRKWGNYQTHLGALSFGSLNAARTYALNPNRRDDIPSAPRVTSAYLSIQNPVMNRPGDPYVELPDIAKAIGQRRARKIALDFKDYITHTCNWCDRIGSDFESFEEYFGSKSFDLDELYFVAYALFDDMRYAAVFKRAGFDGAIHGGDGVTFGETEFKVFGAEQVWPVSTENVR